jgi:hypothetical protein
VATSTSLDVTPGRLMLWQKYFAKGKLGMINVYLVVCRKLVLFGIVVRNDSVVIEVPLHYL